jgi:hypothetical protein
MLQLPRFGASSGHSPVSRQDHEPLQRSSPFFVAQQGAAPRIMLQGGALHVFRNPLANLRLPLRQSPCESQVGDPRQECREMQKA